MMRKLKVYSTHKGSSPDRFDTYNTKYLVTTLSKKYEVEWLEFQSDSSFQYNGIPLDHGSILIFEFADTKEFKTYDFGDSPKLTLRLSKDQLFRGAAIGQYNPTLWDKEIKDKDLRSKIKASIYPETYWQLGHENYETVQQYRQGIKLDNRLYWRGSLYIDQVPPEYIGIRKTLEVLPNYLSPEEFYFGNYPISFETYIQEAIHSKLALSIGGGGGYTCGDFCFRDIEMFGLGIPLLRPEYIVETANPLIPNYHYISIPATFTDEFKYKEPEILASNIARRYRSVIKDVDYLSEVASNAKIWYTDNIVSPNITEIILKALDL